MSATTIAIGLNSPENWPPCPLATPTESSSLSNQMKVLFQGKELPQVGSITMDQLIVDVSDLDSVSVGDTLTLLGQQGNESL